MIHHSAIFLVGLVAGIVAFFSAQPSVGATVDSGEYLAVAEGIVDGHGLSMPYMSYDEPYRVLEPGERVTMTQFPPLYPALLATTQKLGFSPLDGARALAALCFAITAWVAAALVARERADVRAVALAGALLLSADLVIVHSMAWSETVMLAALVGALAFTVRYFREGRFVDLVVVVVLVIIASAARFVGLSAAPAIALGLVVASRGSLMTRLHRALGFLAVCVIPTAAWFVRNASILGTPSEKEVGWYLPGLTHVQQALNTVGGWVIPWKAAMPFAGGAVVIVAFAVAIKHLPRILRTGPSSVPRACVWFAVSYALFVLLSRSLLDQNIAFDFRILSPLYVLLVVGICSTWKGQTGMATVLLVALAAASVVRGVDTARTFSGLSVAAYTGDTWRASPTLKHAGDTPPDTLLITNAPDPIWIWHRREPMVIPPRSSLYSGEPNEGYARDVREMLLATRCRDAIVVFFDQPTRKPRRYIEPLLVRGLGLTRTHRFSDGEIYEVSEPPCEAEA